MKKILFIASVALLSFSMTSCSSDELVTDVPGGAEKSFTGTVKAQSQDGTVSTDITLKSDNKNLLTSQMNDFNYILVKNSEVEAYAKNIEEEDTELEEPANAETGIVEFTIETPLEGYHLTMEPKNKDLKAIVSGYCRDMSINKTQDGRTAIVNNWRGWVEIENMGWYHHPRNGKRTYKLLLFDSYYFTEWKTVF